MAVLRDGTEARSGMSVRCVDNCRYEYCFSVGGIYKIDALDSGQLDQVVVENKHVLASRFVLASPIDALPESELREKTRRLVDAVRNYIKGPASDHYHEVRKAAEGFDAPPQPDIRQLAMESLVKTGFQLANLSSVPIDTHYLEVSEKCGGLGCGLDYYVFPEAVAAKKGSGA